MERSLQHVKTPEKQEGLRGSADCRLAIFNHQSFLVPSAGLEPAWVAPYAPQTYVSTNSTTTARYGFAGPPEGLAGAGAGAAGGGAAGAPVAGCAGTGTTAPAGLGSGAGAFCVAAFCGSVLTTDERGLASSIVSTSASTMKPMKATVVSL